jgi:PAS domain S-box-containing protein
MKRSKPDTDDHLKPFSAATIQARLRKVDRHEWVLWSFAFLVTILLLVGIASFSLPAVHARMEAGDTLNLRLAINGLIGLVLLFDIYTIYQRLQIHRIRQQLIEREEMFRLISEHAADMIAVVDAAGRRIYNSPAYQKVLGYTQEELNNTLGFEQVHPDDRSLVEEAARAARQFGVGRRIEYRMRHKDGSWRHLESSASTIRNEKGEVEKLIIVNRDVTDRRKAGEALRESEERFKSLFENALLGIYRTTPDGKVLMANPTLCRMLGYSSFEELQKHNLEEKGFNPDYSREDFKKELEEKGSVVGLEAKWRRRDGTIIFVRETARIVLDPLGNLQYYEGTVEDVTARKRAEEALSEERRLLRTLIDNMPDYIYVRDSESRFLLANHALAQLVGAKSPEDLLGKSDSDFFPKELAEAFYADDQRIIRTGQGVLNQEEASMDSQGNAKWTLTSKVPLRDKSGHVIGIMGIGRDITKRRQSEKELRESQEKFTKAFYSSPESMLISTLPQGRIIEVNDATLRLWEYDRSDVIGKTTSELGIWVSPDERAAFIQRVTQKGSSREEKTTFRSKSGKINQVRISAEIIQSENELCLLSIIRDITEQEALELQLRQSQKMEAVGRLSGGVAHDFNNLLGVIIGYTEFLQEQIEETNPLRKSIDEVLKAGRRAAALTRQLLAFSRQQVLDPKVLDLNNVVSEMEKMLRRLIREDIELVTTLDPGLGKVKADQGQIEQVIMNLVVNARDAMPQGGKLIVKTGNFIMEESFVRQFPYPVKAGPYICITVTDTGIGMDAETRSRAFEPFFTTKEKGMGTGLGLSMVYGIVKQSGGYINVESSPGAGATFHIYLPRSEDATEPDAVVSEAVCAAGGHETILLVEDEDSLRSLTRQSLESSGYQVLEARDGTSALETSMQHRGTIDLLLTDIVMPGMNGRALAQELIRRRPEIKIVYMSGYTGQSYSDESPINPGSFFLAKPFSRQVLTSKIREALDAVAVVPPNQ